MSKVTAMVENMSIRRATVDDAASIVAIWQAIVAERVYSAVDIAFTQEEERAYIAALSPREGIFLGEQDGQVVGFQTLDLWARYLHSMEHVGSIGSFVLQAWRGRGIGRQLARHTLQFARSAAFEKLIIFIRASNTAGQKYYQGLGFVPCGRFKRQTKIDGQYDDEILMELFL